MDFFTDANDDLHLPNPTLLRLIDRSFLSMIALATIVGVALALWPTAAREHLRWWMVGAGLFMLVVLAIAHFDTGWDFVPSWLRNNAAEVGGLVGWTWLSLLLLGAREQIPLLSLAILWPAYIPPFVLYLLPNSPTSRTRRVLILILLTVAILAICTSEALARFSQPSQVAPSLVEYSIVVVLLWLVSALPLMHYVVRRQQLDQIREDTVQELMVTLANIDDPFAAASQITDLLHQRTGLGDRIFILQHNPMTMAVQVVAWAGAGADAAAYCELDQNCGIAWRAIRTKEIQIVGDVAEDADFFAGGLPANGSELSVPILMQTADGTDVLGTINVQSNARHNFDRRSAQLVKRMADIIGAFSRHHLDQFDSTMASVLGQSAFYQLHGSEALASIAVAGARSLFQADCAWYMRLAVGTYVPIGEPFLAGEFNDPEALCDPALLGVTGEIADWILGWSPHFHSQAQSQVVREDAPLAALWHHVRASEGASAMAALPIGGQQSRNGLLLLIWRTPHLFSRSETTNLLSFAHEIAPYLEREQYRETIYLGFARLQAYFHSSMAEAGLSRGSWEHTIQEVLDLDRTPSPALHERVERFKAGLQKFLMRLRSAESNTVAKFRQLGYVSLRENLQVACGELQQQLPGMILRVVEPEISDENNDVKLIVFTVVMEAIRNALVHGRSPDPPHIQIQVRIRRLPRAIQVHVTDDGCGFDPVESMQQALGIAPTAPLSPDGIFFLDRLAQRQLGAPPIDWTDSAPGCGVRLVWTVPTLSQATGVAEHVSQPG